jgi:hypothetical protein
MDSEQLLRNCGKNQPQKVTKSNSLGEALKRVSDDEFFCYVLTEAAIMAWDALNFTPDEFVEHKEYLQDKVLWEQWLAIDECLSRKVTSGVLSLREADMLKNQIFGDFVVIYVNREGGRNLRIWEEMLELYKQGYFPCGLESPLEEPEDITEEFLNSCKVSVF